MRKLVLLWAALAVTGCGLSNEPLPENSDAALRMTYERIVDNANHLLLGDGLFYRAESGEAERVETRCRGPVCSLGFGRPSTSENFSVEDVALEHLGKTGGVHLVRERASGERSDSEVYGGWMKHSFFAAQSNLFTDSTDPNEGYTRVISYAVGDTPGTNPAVEGSARWYGLMVGYGVGPDERGRAFRGDATISVELGQSGMEAVVAFTGIVDIETGAMREAMAWDGMTVRDGAFGNETAPNDKISGRFFGPGHEEAGGVFERGGIAGGFGGARR